MAFELLKEHFGVAGDKIRKSINNPRNNQGLLNEAEYKVALGPFEPLYAELEEEGRNVRKRRWSGEWPRRSLVPGQFNFLLFRNLLRRETKDLRKQFERWQRGNRRDYQAIDEPLTKAEQGSREIIEGANKLSRSYQQVEAKLVSNLYSPDRLFSNLSQFPDYKTVSEFLSRVSEVERMVYERLKSLDMQYDCVDGNISRPGEFLTSQQRSLFEERLRRGRGNLSDFVEGLNNDKIVPGGITDNSPELTELFTTLKGVDRLEGMLATLDQYNASLQDIITNLSQPEPKFEVPGSFYRAKFVDVAEAQRLIPGEKFTGARQYYLHALKRFDCVDQRKADIQEAYKSACDRLIAEAIELNSTPLKSSSQIYGVKDQITGLKRRIDIARKFSLPQIIPDAIKVQSLADQYQELERFNLVLTKANQDITNAGRDDSSGFAGSFRARMSYLNDEWHSDGPCGIYSHDDLVEALNAYNDYRRVSARASPGLDVDPRVSALYGERHRPSASSQGLDEIMVGQFKNYVAQAHLANLRDFRDTQLLRDLGINLKDYQAWQRPELEGSRSRGDQK